MTELKIKLSDIVYWVQHPFFRIAALGIACYCIFFIAEHNPTMAKIKNFVMDIEIQEEWSDGGNSLRRLAFLGCAGIGILGLLSGSWRGFRWCLPLFMAAVYVTWCGVSVAWSIDPGTTARRYVLVLCCVAGCIGATRFFTPREIILATVVTLTMFLFTGIAAELVFGAFRPYHGEYRFAGTLHPNSQAANLSILCIALFTLVRAKANGSFYFLCLLGFATIMLILTKSRTATLAMFVGVGAIWLVSQDNKRIVILGALGLWLVSVLGFLILATGFDPAAEYQDVLLMGRAEETGSSLTGRLPLWSDLSAYISDRPWFGHGFGAFWDARHVYEVSVGQEWVISEAHSSYVESTLQVGLIGCGLMILTGLSALWFSVTNFRASGEPYFLFLLGGVIFCLIRSFSESGLSEPSGFSSALFLIVCSHCWKRSASPFSMFSSTANSSAANAT